MNMKHRKEWYRMIQHLTMREKILCRLAKHSCMLVKNIWLCTGMRTNGEKYTESFLHRGRYMNTGIVTDVVLDYEVVTV